MGEYVVMEKYLNKITLGDSYKLIKELPDNSIDCVYTDIPYLYVNGGLGYSEMCERTARKKQELKDISNGIDYSILDEFKRVLKKVNIFIWCSKMQLLDIMNWGGSTTKICLFGAKVTLHRKRIMFGCPIWSIAFI